MNTSSRSSSRSQNPNGSNYSYPSAYNNTTIEYNMASRNSTSNTRSSSAESHSRAHLPLQLPPKDASHDPSNHSKKPSFSSSALAIPIPSLTPPASSHSASSDLETMYLRRTRRLRRLRLLLSLPMLCTALAILTTQGLALKFYNDTTLPAAFYLPLWPEQMDLRPVYANLVAGGVIAVSCVLYMLVASVPSPHPRTTILSILFALTTFLSLAASIVALIFTAALSMFPSPAPGPLASTTSHTIQSWTCFLANSATRYNADVALFQLTLAATTPTSVSAPTGFERTCHESQASWGLVIGAVAMEFIGLAFVAWGWWIERGIGRERMMKGISGGMRRGEKSSVSRMSW